MGKRKTLINRCRISFKGDRNALELHGKDGCTLSKTINATAFFTLKSEVFNITFEFHLHKNEASTSPKHELISENE